MDNGYVLGVPQAFGQEQVESRRKTEHLEQTIVDLYAAMRPALVGYAYQLMGSSGDAEDLVQIAFLKLFDQLQKNVRIENVRSWLYRVIHNEAIDQFRHQGKQESALGTWMTERIRNEAVENTELDYIQRQRIAQSLEELNPRERNCLVLRAEGLSYREISAVLAISEKAVSVYLARGLKKLEGRSEGRNEACA